MILQKLLGNWHVTYIRRTTREQGGMLGTGVSLFYLVLCQFEVL